jgi:GDP-4-dehydro-6-deoxy-D-mannose reductase
VSGVRAFVTGGQGFVGTWLGRHLESMGDECVLAGPEVDITDPSLIGPAIHDAAPDVIYHLAALASVADSWRDPATTFEVNATGTLRVLEAARTCAMPPTVLLVCSAEVYGTVTPDQLPLTEDAPLKPSTPYAVSKVAAEFLGLQAFLSYGLRVIRVRAFNHIGPGQAGSFVVSDLAKRVAALERDGGNRLRVGNTTTRRDFTDVRDVVRAYRLLVEQGKPGEVYNVCSGVDISIQHLIDRLLDLSGVPCEIEVDQDLIRPVDIPVLRGDPSRLRDATGWEPQIPLDQTLREILAEQRAAARG